VDCRAYCIGGYGWGESGFQLHQQRFHPGRSEARGVHQLEEKYRQTERTPLASSLHKGQGHPRARRVTVSITSFRSNVRTLTLLQTCSGEQFKKQRLRTEAKETAGVNEIKAEQRNYELEGIRRTCAK